jgi:hypothetical protein
LAIELLEGVVGLPKCDGQEKSNYLVMKGKPKGNSPDQNDQSIPGGSTTTVAIARDGTHPINPA